MGALESESRYYDFHTHRMGSSSDGVVAIVNVSQKDWCVPMSPELFSAGLHPWYLGQSDAFDFQYLEGLAGDDRLRVIGECGLDRLVSTPMDVQMEVFERQIRFAERIRKPVVVHCVRAFGELVGVQRRLQPTVPLVVHGFNHKISILRELLGSGFYISLGSALMRLNSAAAKGIVEIPRERLLLETDDSGLGIEEIYERAALLMDMKIVDLKSIIECNFAGLF